MADRQQFFSTIPADPELKKILEASKNVCATEDELREQRISFAVGNAPQGSESRITKDSVRMASEHIRLLPWVGSLASLYPTSKESPQQRASVASRDLNRTERSVQKL